jgi:prepilin-type N-terminal cleavage/methylation domain-containing protein
MSTGRLIETRGIPTGMRAARLTAPRHSDKRRQGFSLIEMMIAMTMMLLIFAIVIPFMQTQMHQVGRTAGDLDALQNARFSQNMIDRELRVAGAGVVPQQSFIVQAAPMAVTFNADLVTADSTDPTAVYYDPNVDTSTTHALPFAQAVTLPNSVPSFNYPGQDYVSSPGVLSTAETISYYLVIDPTQPVGNIYTLYRRVNAAAPTVISTGISVPAGTAFFQYYKLDAVTGGLDSIPNASLPLYHTAVQHSSPADTGQSARTDSIRAVQMVVTGMYDDPTRGPVYKTVTTMTKLLNAGLLYASECGQPPIPVNTPAANWYGPGPTTDSVTVTWTASPDQNGGEQNVQFYMVYRKATATVDWGNPVESVPAGTATYEYKDPAAPNLHGSYQYDVIAQNCTPSNSPDAISNTVTLP